MHQIDWLPQYYDLNKLGDLIGLSTDEVVRMTFTPIYDKLFTCDTDLDRYRSTLGKELDMNRRKFCPVCINTNGYYKLMWQVKKIKVCDEHMVHLEETCPTCGKHQKYVSVNMLSNHCCHCESLLTEKERVVVDTTYYKEQLREYNTWSFLINKHTSLFQNIPGLDLTQSLACLVLYLSRKDQDSTTYERSNTHLFGLPAIKGFSSLVRNPNNSGGKKVTLQDIWKVTHGLGFCLEELSETCVPAQFLESFTSDNKTKGGGKCVSPWCQFYGSSLGMKMVNQRIMKNNIRYLSVYFCESCFMRYIWQNKEWKEVDEWVKQINIIKPLFESGLERAKIAKEIGCNSQKINEYLGYMLQYRILNEAHCREWLPSSTQADIVDRFRKLECYYPHNYQRAWPLARKRYGWSSVEFYYYAADKRVKCDQIFNQGNIMIDSYKEQIVQKLEELSRVGNFTFSVSNVVKELKCTDRTLSKYGLKEKIHTLREKQRKQLYDNEEQYLRLKINEYIELSEKEKRPLVGKEVYAYLGKNTGIILKKFPQLATIISKAVEASRAELKEDNMRQTKEEIKEAIKAVYLIYGRLSIRLVCEYMNKSRITPLIAAEIQQFKLSM
jgi:hypothetical protein